MTEPKKIEPFYQHQAKMFVDNLFEKKYFNADLTRDDMNDVENLVGYMFQTLCESSVRMDRVTRRIAPHVDRLAIYGEGDRQPEEFPSGAPENVPGVTTVFAKHEPGEVQANIPGEIILK